MYFLASNLVGFKNSSLRVKFVSFCSDEGADRYVNVITADLLDAGTKLTLRLSNLKDLNRESCAVGSYGFFEFC
jgi:hypothetical protein